MLCIAIVALMTPGCASSPAPSRTRTPPLPGNLTAPCPTLPQPAGPTFGEVLEHDVTVVGLYAECASRQRALAEAVEIERRGKP
jgi:hypothetical protein